jgi:phospholipid transport system substrate-binding protein
MPLPHRGFYSALAFALLLASTPLGHEARAGDDASAFIVQLGEQATATMSNRAISSTDRILRFAVIVDRDFDVPKIAQFMLGRYWQNATATERDEFTNVFRNYMIRIYSDNFANYSTDTFHVIDQRMASELTTIVRTEITEIVTHEPMTIEWRVVKTPEGFKVFDLTVGGVSLAAAQQEQFTAAIQRNGGQVSILIKMVRSQLTQMETAQQ